MHRLLAVRTGMWAATLLALLAAAARAAPAERAALLHSHVVVPGDTLIGLLRPGADWRAVQRANGVADPRRLQPGRSLKIPLELLRERPATATVLHARGDTTVMRPGSGAAAPLPAGATVSSGDVLVTGAQSSLTLQLADGSRLLLRPDSRLRLEGLGQLGTSALGTARLQLDYGSTDTLVTPAAAPVPRRYQLRTPVANLGVRGTEFRTRTDASQTHLEVLSGSVETLGGGAPQRIGGGFGAVLLPAQPAMPARPLLAAPELSGVPERIEKLPLRLAWTASPAAAGYRAQMYAGSALTLDGRFDHAEAAWADDLPDGRYELRVRAVAADGLEGQDARTAVTLKARPEPPFTSQPRNGARTIDAAPTFAWSRSSVATSYRLQVATGPDFQVLRFDQIIAVTEQRIELPAGTYHWRVASVRADGDQGPYSDAQTVVCIPPPPAPPLQPPVPRADGLLLRWRSADEAGARYRLQIAYDADFQRIETDAVIDRSEWLLGPDPVAARYVRVMTLTADGLSGPFGEVQRVEVPPPPPSPWLLLIPMLMLLL